MVYRELFKSDEMMKIKLFSGYDLLQKKKTLGKRFIFETFTH